MARFTDLARGSLTVSTHFMKPLARVLSKHDLEFDTWLADHGVTEAGERIPFADAAKLWRAAVAQTGDPALGIRIARASQDGDYGVLEFAIRASLSLRDGLERIARFHRLVNDHVRVTVQERGDETWMHYDRGALAEAMPPAYLEYVFAGWLHGATRLTGHPPPLLAVRLPHPAPENVELHRACYGDGLVFDADEPAIVFERSVLEAPLDSGDAGVAAVLDRHAEATIEQLALEGQWSRRVLEAVEARLADGTPSLTQIADALSTAESTLRRRLRGEGTTFTELVDDLRRRRAEIMVADPSLSLAEIAFLLGFSEASAFHRAYRRWTGHTPRGT